MKIRNIFMSLLAVVFAATGCVEEKMSQLDELQVSQSIIGFDAENPEAVEVIFNATADWAIASADGKELPAWFTVEPLQGTAGETTVVFKAAGADKIAHEADLVVNVFDPDKNVVAVQHIMVKQGVQSKEETPLETISKEGVVGATYYVHAIIAEVTNGKYGNLILQDAIPGQKGTLNVYGTLNENGEEGKFSDLGLAVGDEIWAHGPFQPYKGTPQLKNITVDKFKKSLISLEEDMDKFEVAKEGKVIEVKLKVAGKNVDIDPGCDWISVAGININEGKGSVKLTVAANTDVKPRTAKVKFISGESTVVTEVTQLGNVPEKITIADAMKESYVHVNGTVLATCKKGYVIADDTDAIFVYYGNKERPYDNSKKIGDKVDVVGARSVYNYAPQINDPQLDEVIGKGDAKTGDPVVYDPAKMDALVATLAGKDKTKDILVDIQYVKMTGKLSYGDNYKNLIVEGTKNQGSLYNIDDAMGLKKFDGQNIDLYGYLVQISGGKYFNIVVTDAKPAGEVVLKPVLEESFMEGFGKFTIENKTVPAGKEVWSHGAYNKVGYAKASGHFGGKDGSDEITESYLISPVFEVKSAASNLTFDHCGKYFKGADDAAILAAFKEAVSVVVREEGAKDWKKLEIPGWGTGKAYDYVSSDKISMSAYNGKKIQIAFKYTSTKQCAGTWQIQNVLVK